MRMLWRPAYELKGNGYGYTTHQKNLKAALERREDVEFVEREEDADVAVDITMPSNYRRTSSSALDVLYTMYETQTLPDDWKKPLDYPDLIVVPNSHNFRLFSYYTHTPIEIVYEGINAEKFELRKRELPGEEPFVFLWIGASNPRKGYQHLSYAWGLFCKKFPEIAKNCVLIMKTTQETKAERLEQYPVALSNGGRSKVFVDTRDYSLSDLIELYHYSHAFLFPSMGEGWGLTLHEAMATGLPAIYTNYSAMRDWVPKKYAYPLKYEMKKIRTLKNTGHGQEVHHETYAASADIEHLVRRMAYVYDNYQDAAIRGYKAGEIVRRQTWDKSADSFVKAIGKHIDSRERVAV